MQPPPAYTDIGGDIVIPTNVKFPPAMNGYFPKQIPGAGLSNFHLGISSERHLFLVETHSGGFKGTKPTISLHDGVDVKDAVLATAGSENWMQTKYVIKTTGYGSRGEDKMSVSMSAPKAKRTTYLFTMPVGNGSSTTNESFEWRSTTGSQIRDFAKGRAVDWKLVRLNGPPVSPQGSGESAVGFTDDGQEVVAILALSPPTSMRMQFRFTYTGIGLVGTLGTAWEIVSLTSAALIWSVTYPPTSYILGPDAGGI